MDKNEIELIELGYEMGYTKATIDCGKYIYDMTKIDVQPNLSDEDKEYWYKNGCWDESCKGYCEDPTCTKRLIRLIDEEEK